MAEIELFCIIESVPAGLLWQDAAGLIFFRYADDCQGIPLSLSMPITNRTYGQKTVGPYLFGLLPDREEQRRAMAREYGGRPNNAVTLLAHIGMERVFERDAHIPGMDELREHLLGPVARNCDQTLALLG